MKESRDFPDNCHVYFVIQMKRKRFEEAVTGQAKKIESSDNLPGKPFQGDMFKKIISKFENSNVSEKMRKNENLVFYLINYVIGESLGWRTTDFEELYGDLGQ